MHAIARSSIVCALLLLACVSVAADRLSGHDEPHLYVLHLTDEGFRLEPLRLRNGESRSFVSDSDSDVVDVIYPVSEGQSGNLVQRSSNRYTLTVRRDGNTYLSSTRSSTGRARGLPPVAIADLGEYRIRVNATAADGRKAVFIIDDGTQTRRETGGRVIDMFQGMIPMSAGDVSITTEIEKPKPLPAVHGEAGLVYDAGLLYTKVSLAGGAPSEFVVDFAAGGTVVGRSALPRGAEIQPVIAVEYSEKGSREIRGQMQGAGGEVQGFLGRTVLPELAVGNMIFRDVEVSVLASMPELGGHTPSGILGMDLLTRADVACVSYADQGKPGHLRLGKASHVSGVKAAVVPFRKAGNHLFVEGKVEDAPVTFVFDTGARRAHLHPAVASAAGLTLRADDHSEGTRGLDGKKMDTRLTTSDRFHLGSSHFRNVPFVVADLPVFRAIGLGEDAGLLGNTFLERFTEIEVDFRNEILRFVD
jgi:predicted aspartyl protease